MTNMVPKILAVGLILGIVPVKARTPISLADSNSAKVVFSGIAEGNPKPDLAGCGQVGCSVSGSLTGFVIGDAPMPYALSLIRPFNFMSNNNGVFSAGAASGSSADVAETDRKVLFRGGLSSLKFYPSAPPARTEGNASVLAARNQEKPMLATAVNLESHVKAQPVRRGGQSAPSAPGPASMLLFGSGLMVLGGILRRRNSASDQSERTVSIAAPLFS